MKVRFIELALPTEILLMTRAYNHVAWAFARVELEEKIQMKFIKLSNSLINISHRIGLPVAIPFIFIEFIHQNDYSITQMTRMR